MEELQMHRARVGPPRAAGPKDERIEGDCA
jgi:hypothetical protein